jgi:hypothetical protein
MAKRCWPQTEARDYGPIQIINQDCFIHSNKYPREDGPYSMWGTHDNYYVALSTTKEYYSVRIYNLMRARKNA